MENSLGLKRREKNVFVLLIIPFTVQWKVTPFKKNMTIHIEHHTVVEAAAFECIFGGQRREPTVPEHRLTSQRWSCTRLFNFIVGEKTKKTKWHSASFFFLYNRLAYERQEHFTATIFVCSGCSNFFDCWHVVIIVVGECSVHRKPVWFEILRVCDLWSCVVHLKKTAHICTLSTLFKTWMHELSMHYNQQPPLYWPISVFLLFTCTFIS